MLVREEFKMSLAAAPYRSENINILVRLIRTAYTPELDQGTS
jgi:hypothetical protein